MAIEHGTNTAIGGLAPEGEDDDDPDLENVLCSRTDENAGGSVSEDSTVLELAHVWARCCQWLLNLRHRGPAYDLLPLQKQSATHTLGQATLTVISTIKAIFGSSWLNVLLVFVPMGIMAGVRKTTPVITFALNAISIIPLSSLLAYATECMASELGDTVGALLNISFGNIVEVVMFVVGLIHGEVKVVQSALVGSILVNLLLILGSAVICGEFRLQEMVYDMNNAQGLACLLSLAVFSILIPTALHFTIESKPDREHDVLILSRASAVILLVVYAVYLIFLLRPARRSLPLGDSESCQTRSSSPEQRFSGSVAASLVPRTIRFADERSSNRSSFASVSVENIAMGEMDLDGADKTHSLPKLSSVEATRTEASGRPTEAQMNDGDRNSSNFLGLPSTSRNRPQSRSRSRSRSLSTHRRPRHTDIAERYGYSIDSVDRTPLHRLSSQLSLYSSATHAGPPFIATSISAEKSPLVIGRAAAMVLLAATSLLVAVCADFLVGTIEDITSSSRDSGILSESLIGLIILPIAGNTAEHITAVTVALKGKLDLAIGVSLGSSIQIALFVSPLMVIVGWGLGKDMTLYFGLFEVITLVGSGMLVNFVIWNGKTNYLEGVMLCACYAMIG